MVAVLIWGFWQLVWRRMQQKKYKCADPEKSQVVGEANTEGTSKSDEIPFGIRALEAGVEVEGVVISRPTSPRPVHNRNPSNMTLVDGRSSMGSLFSCAQPNSSRNSLGPPSPGLVTTLNNVQQPMTSPLRSVYQPNPYGFSGSTIQNLPLCHSSAASTRTMSAENVPTVAEPNLPRPGPSTRGPSSPPLVYNNRVSAMINSQRRSGTYEAPRSGQLNVYWPSRSPTPPEPSPLPSLSENQGSDPRDSDSSGSSSEDDKQTTSTDMHSSSNPSSDEGTGDLTLMQTHRLSHAAEVGQLTRRPPGQPRIQSTSSMHSIRATNTTPNSTVYNTASSPVYPMDIAMPSSASLDSIEFQQSQRRSLSAFQYNQHVELAREHFQPQLAAQPRDENVGRVDDSTPTSSRPASIRSKKSFKKLVKKNRQSQAGEGGV
ncbi:hypothetical protein BGX38DRAFT_1264690 [Terfezia claveryi]|nr:hypothetical protein BGX38DRAFT_1264690 [Terfezia claveryi]